MKKRKFETMTVADVPRAVKVWWVLLAVVVVLWGWGWHRVKSGLDAWYDDHAEKTAEWDKTVAAILEHRQRSAAEEQARAGEREAQERWRSQFRN